MTKSSATKSPPDSSTEAKAVQSQAESATASLMRFDDVTARLSALAVEHENESRFYSASIKEFAIFFSSPYVALVVNESTGSVHVEEGGQGTNGAFWKSHLQEFMDETLTNPSSSRYKLLQARRDTVRAAMIAAPLWDESGKRIGCVVCVTEVTGKEQARFRLSQIERMALFLALFRRQQSVNDSTTGNGKNTLTTEMLAGVSNFKSTTEFAYSITNGLRSRTDCDMVAMAVVTKKSVKILSVSGADDVNLKSPGVRAMLAAFEETLDFGEPLVWPQGRDWLDQDIPRNHRLHRQWSEAANGSHVASIPMMVNDKCVGILGIRRPTGDPFTPDQISSLQQTCGSYGPAFEIVDRATRGLVKHVAAHAVGASIELFNPRMWLRNLVKVGLLALIVWFAFGSAHYEIPAPATLMHAVRQNLAAPYDARITKVQVKAGEKVIKGQILCQFETDENELELNRIRSEISVATIEERRSLADGNAAEAALSKARIQSLNASAAITLAKIERASVRAPEDGVVLVSKVRDRLGDSIQQGELLFEVGSLDKWIVELRIDEGDVGLLAELPEGAFACRARPEEKQDISIVRIRPLAEQIDGRNVFVAEAKLGKLPAWARSGMEGLATVDVGEKRIRWIAARRAIDWLKLNFWL